MTSDLTRVLRFALAGAAAAAACAAAACGPPGPVRAAPPDAAVADAPWETAWDAAECTVAVTGRIVQPADPPSETDPLVGCAGARVQLLLPRPDGAAPLVPVAETASDADGAFRVGAAPPGVFVVRATKPGFADALGASNLRIPGAVELGGNAKPMLGMQPAVKVRGRVVDPKGRPVAGVRVEAVALAYAEETRTAADGTFEVSAPVAKVVVSVTDPAWDVVRELIETSADGAPVDVRTSPVEPYSGFVLTAEDDRPVEGAVVLSLEDPTQRATTGADGRFRLAVPRVGRVAVFAAGRGWHSYEMARASEQEVRLAAVRGVQGRVTDAEGRPVPQARLLALVEGRDGRLERVRGPLTDADGRYDFSWLPRPRRGSAEPALVVAWHRLRGVSDAAAVPAEGTLDLRLSGWRSVTGTVRDHGGAPVAGAEVTAAWKCAALDDARAGLLGVPLHRQTFADASGAFRLDGVPADRPSELRCGVYGLEILHTVPAGRDAAAHAFALPQGRELAGAVVDGRGAPVARAVVSAELVDVPGVKLRRLLSTGADGAFRFEDLPAGRYALEANAEGFDLRGGAEAQPGRTDVRLVVERSGSLSLRLAFAGLAEGETRPDLMVAIEDAAAPHLPPKRIRFTGAAVAAPLATGGLHPGRWRVSVEGGLWRGRTDVIELGDGDARTVDVTMERTLRLRAVLLDGRGAPMSGQQVVFVPGEGTAGTTISSWSGDGGVVDVAGFRPGAWDVRIAPRNEAPFAARLPMPAPDGTEFRLPPSGEVTARVLDASGKPVAGAIVGLADAGGKPLYGWTDEATQLVARGRTGADGTVRFRGVPEGRVRVEASSGGRRLPPQECDVSGAKPAEVTWGP